jgi:hypothetical protein
LNTEPAVANRHLCFDDTQVTGCNVSTAPVTGWRAQDNETNRATASWEGSEEDEIITSTTAGVEMITAAVQGLKVNDDKQINAPADDPLAQVTSSVQIETTKKRWVRQYREKQKKKVANHARPVERSLHEAGARLSAAMSIMGWNCRGLGQAATIQELERLVHTHKPKLLFLSETRQKKEYVEGLRWRLGLKHVVTFSEEGKGGGLALFWDESICVELFKNEQPSY